MTEYTLNLLDLVSRNWGSLISEYRLKRKISELYDKLGALDAKSVVDEEGFINLEKLKELTQRINELRGEFSDLPDLEGHINRYFSSTLLPHIYAVENRKLKQMDVQRELAEAEIKKTEEQIRLIGKQIGLTDEEIKRLNLQNEIMKIENRLTAETINALLERKYPIEYALTMVAYLQHLQKLYGMDPMLFYLSKFGIRSVDPNDVLSYVKVLQATEKDIRNLIEEWSKYVRSNEEIRKFLGDIDPNALLSGYFSMRYSYGSVDEFLNEYKKAQELLGKTKDPQERKELEDFLKHYELFYKFATKGHSEAKVGIYNMLDQLWRNYGNTAELYKVITGLSKFYGINIPAPTFFYKEVRAPKIVRDELKKFVPPSLKPQN